MCGLYDFIYISKYEIYASINTEAENMAQVMSFSPLLSIYMGNVIQFSQIYFLL